LEEELMKAIILAAGEGKRMKSAKAKVMHEILGKPIIGYIVDSVFKAGSEQVILVVGHKREQLRDYLKDRVEYVVQEEQLGTGHAARMASDYLRENGDVLVLYGDMPLVRPETIEIIQKLHMEENNGVTAVSVMTEAPGDFGRIIREDGMFSHIVEARDCTEEQKAVQEINTGIYLFKEEVLKRALELLENNNSQGEYYLTDTIEIIRKLGYKADAVRMDDIGEFLGINSRWQLAAAAAEMKRRINLMHMDNGVSIIDPSNTYIGPDAVIGEDSDIYPGVIIEGSCVIGNGCIIGPNSRLVNTKVGDGSLVEYSVALDSEIGGKTKVGPYAYLRPNSKIGNKCKIGDFVEVKNSIIGDNTKASHLTYIGDSDVGDNVNFGCGTITTNYDGRNKYRTVIKDSVFIGCNTNLIAPVTIEDGAYIAAGSTITKDVPKEALGIARAYQVNKEDWNKK